MEKNSRTRSYVALAAAIASCARLRTFLEGSEEIFIDLRDA